MVVHTFGPFIHVNTTILRHLDIVELTSRARLLRGGCFPAGDGSPLAGELSTWNVEKPPKGGQLRDLTQRRESV